MESQTLPEETKRANPSSLRAWCPFLVALGWPNQPEGTFFGPVLSPRWLHLTVWLLLAPQGRHQPTFTTSGAGGGPCSQHLPLLSCCGMVPCYAGVPQVLLCPPFGAVLLPPSAMPSPAGATHRLGSWCRPRAGRNLLRWKSRGRRCRVSPAGGREALGFLQQPFSHPCVVVLRLAVPGEPPGHPPTSSPSEGKGQKWQKPARHLLQEAVGLSMHLAKQQHAASGLAKTC